MAVVSVALLSIAPPLLLADDELAPEWGTPVSVVTVPSQAWAPDNSGFLFGAGTQGRICLSTTADCIFGGAFHVQSGARIVGFQLEACDSSATGQVTAELLSCAVGVTTCTVLATVATGAATQPGCTLVTSGALNVTVNNAGVHYPVRITLTGDLGGGVAARAVRTMYQLQVSAPPGSPTFTDVPPTHQQFRFIEALVASRITAGCGSGNYCPDAPLTRGQMGVFLAVALGLHFPN